MSAGTLLQDLKRKTLRVIEDCGRERVSLDRSWFVLWKVTFACNLTCKYCGVPIEFQTRPKRGEAGKHLDILKRLNPRSLILFGGEPTMAADLPEAVREMKAQRPEMWIQLNTNGVLEPGVTELIPMMNQLELSLDAIGESSKFLTGTSAQPLLEKFKRYHRLAQQTGTAISVHAVITRHNYRDLPELARWMADELPGVWLSIRPIIPDNHPLSVQSDPELNADFMRIVEELPEELGRSFISDPTRQGKVQCSRQFFRTVVDYDGSLGNCKLDQTLMRLRYQHYLDLPRWKGAVQAGKDLATSLDSLVLRPRSRTCLYSCEWFLPFDRLLNGQIPADHPSLCFVQGTLDFNDLEDLNEFSQRRLGRTFSVEALKPLLKPSELSKLNSKGKDSPLTRNFFRGLSQQIFH